MTDQQTPEFIDYERIQGEDGYGVAVPEHTDETRRLAAESLLTAMEGIEDPEATKQLAELGRSEVFFRHAGDPSDVGCSCEDEGWWCEEGDGERGLFWWFDSNDLAKVTDAAHERGVE